MTIVDLLRSALRERNNLQLVVLFGSHAKGTARVDSDVDVAILPSVGFSIADEAELEDVLSRVSGRQVDLIRLDQVEDVVLRKEIAGGSPLFEATPGTFARFSADAALAWLDIEPVYLDAQARFLRRIARPLERP